MEGPGGSLSKAGLDLGPKGPKGPNPSRVAKSDFQKCGLFRFRASVINIVRLENTIFHCVSKSNVIKLGCASVKLLV